MIIYNFKDAESKNTDSKKPRSQLSCFKTKARPKSGMKMCEGNLTHQNSSSYFNVSLFFSSLSYQIAFWKYAKYQVKAGFS